jgi:hypothetical protein
MMPTITRMIRWMRTSEAILTSGMMAARKFTLLIRKPKLLMLLVAVFSVLLKKSYATRPVSKNKAKGTSVLLPVLTYVKMNQRITIMASGSRIAQDNPNKLLMYLIRKSRFVNSQIINLLT